MCVSSYRNVPLFFLFFFMHTIFYLLIALEKISYTMMLPSNLRRLRKSQQNKYIVIQERIKVVQRSYITREVCTHGDIVITIIIIVVILLLFNNNTSKASENVYGRNKCHEKGSGEGDEQMNFKYKKAPFAKFLHRQSGRERKMDRVDQV